MKGSPMRSAHALFLLSGSLLAGCSSMEKLYVREVRSELSKPAPGAGVLSDSSIAGLPAPVRRYFHFAGLIGRPLPRNARITWESMRLKRGHGKSWMDVSCRQVNAVAEPMRIALMRGRILGILPFEGRDKFQDGHGHMLVKAMGLVKVVDATGRKMDESGLVTVLAEALMVPSYALQPYIAWEELDSARARATMTWKGVKASGVFSFAPGGECTRFDTQVRWQEGNDSLPIPWTAYYRAYGERDGIRFLRELGAAWQEPGGEFEYVQGRIARVDFDVREP